MRHIELSWSRLLGFGLLTFCLLTAMYVPAWADNTGDSPLALGTSGPAVKKLQTHLVALGFAVETDGVFDEATRQALIAFQRANHLEPDGVAGEETKQMLYSVFLPAASQGAPVPTLGDRTLQSGSVGSDVFALQRLFSALGYDVIIDGRFDPRLEAFVMEFQAEAGLTPDGVVGPGTLEALQRAASARHMSQAAPSQSEAVAPEGATSPPSARVNPVGPVDQASRSGPKSVQSPSRTPSQKEIATSVRMDRVTPVSPPPLPTPTQARPSDEGAASAIPTSLRVGVSGSEVRKLQEGLQNLGYEVAVDGHFGPATRRAVEQFQRANGIASDGVAGPETLDRLSAIKSAYVYTVRRGDSLWSIAHAFGTTVKALEALNALSESALQPGQALRVPARRMYEVRPGDALWDIARRFDTTVGTLVRLNHLTDPKALQVGSQLILPAGGTASAGY